ncbi:MAG: S8 family serine peptidase [Woeseia sp.]
MLDTVQDQLDSTVSSEITTTVTEQVEGDVQQDVLDTVEDQVEDDVEDAVDDSLDEAVQQQTDDAVTAGVEETLEDTVGTEIEDSLNDTVEQQTGDAIATGVEETLEGTVESALEGNLDGVVDSAAESGIAGSIEESIDGAAVNVTDDVLDPALPPVDWREDSVIPGVLPAAELELLVRRFNAAADAQVAQDPSRAVFHADLGVDGWMIEKDVFAALVDPGDVGDIDAAGLQVRSRRNLPALGKVLVRFDAPRDKSLREMAVRLRRNLPNARVDYNHLYFQAADDTAQGERPQRQQRGRVASRFVGMIDSAVDTAHPALTERAIEQRDFVTIDALRPDGHGTAVASILSTGLPEDTGVLAASVFFRYEGMAPGATTESLVAALDWMIGRGVDTVNMSLSGPPNALLQEAIENVSGRGVTVVAAVGNNGPAGQPLFPAAYPEVVGVTAVDRNNHVFLYANRGRHVTFASPGVDVRVADVSGSYRTASGTSMASPRVAALIAVESARSQSGRTVVESLKRKATDLGETGFDTVFGYGLVDASPE